VEVVRIDFWVLEGREWDRWRFVRGRLIQLVPDIKYPKAARSQEQIGSFIRRTINFYSVDVDELN
jgi:hypothetical protein